jgi:hypothetical protein
VTEFPYSNQSYSAISFPHSTCPALPSTFILPSIGTKQIKIKTPKQNKKVSRSVSQSVSQYIRRSLENKPSSSSLSFSLLSLNLISQIAHILRTPARVSTNRIFSSFTPLHIHIYPAHTGAL